MLLTENHEITRFKYENEKVISEPSYSIQNEAFVILLIFFEFYQNLNPLSLSYEL
jgi:hypothetical protein